MQILSRLAVRTSLARSPLAFFLGSLTAGTTLLAAGALPVASPAPSASAAFLHPSRTLLLDHDEGVAFLHDEQDQLQRIWTRLFMLRAAATLATDQEGEQSLRRTLHRYALAQVESIDAIVETATWNGITYLDGDPYVIGIARVQGGSDYLFTMLRDMHTTTLGLDALELRSNSSAASALADLDGALSVTNQQRSRVEGDLAQL